MDNKRKMVAYCRVSTNKEEQLHSLQAQKEYFTKYAKDNNMTLLKIYADQGLSGTRLKNRKELHKLMEDSNTQEFDVVVIKDISRLARNTQDALQLLRTLRSNNVDVQFINMPNLGSNGGELIVTILAALAQEESANLSSRVKFGKKANKEKGKVPNRVFGYDKVDDNLFELTINKEEANVVRYIFKSYIEGDGMTKIAHTLNTQGLTTKRGKKWTQNAVGRILRNPIYTGVVVNNKQTVKDFLTGKREDIPEDKWIKVTNKKLQIIDQDTYDKVQQEIDRRTAHYNVQGPRKRHSTKYALSGMIKCAECGYSFRRNVRVYKNTYVYWNCSHRNAHGKDTCSNTTLVHENKILGSILQQVSNIVHNKAKYRDSIIEKTIAEMETRLGGDVDTTRQKQQLEAFESERKQLLLQHRKGYLNDEELDSEMIPLLKQINALKTHLKHAGATIDKETIVRRVDEVLANMEEIASTDYQNVTHSMLSQIVDHITVYADGREIIHFKGLEN